MSFLRFMLLGSFSFIAAAVSYVGGRIILPEMGLTAPEYWAWFWFYVAMVVLYAAWAMFALAVAALTE